MGWPAVTSEEWIWDPPSDRVGPTRAERSAVGRTYRAAVPVRLAGLDLPISSRVAAQAEEAVAEMRAFDAESTGELASLDAILLRSESASSSQIENLTASARAVAEAEVTHAGRGNAALVVANVEAMVAAVELADRLDATAILRMQEVLLRDAAPHLVGWRAEPVWIGPGGSTPLTADFVAPHHSRIRDSIEDLIRFCAREDLPVLAQTAVVHAQFETIHPFADGNGRTGRALVHALLRAKGVTRHVTIPVSGGLLHDRDAYIAALDAYRDGDLEPIVTSFALAGLRAVHHGQLMRARIAAVRDQWQQRVRARRDSAVWRLADALLAHPVVDAATAARQLGISETNVHRHLRVLVDSGVLVPTNHHKARRVLWRAPDVLAVMDAYARDVGRRA
jgi:Fic family protein